MSILGSEEQIQGQLGPRQGLATARLGTKGLESENGHQPRIKIQRGRKMMTAPVLLQALLLGTLQAHLTALLQEGSVSAPCLFLAIIKERYEENFGYQYMCNSPAAPSHQSSISDPFS